MNKRMLDMFDLATDGGDWIGRCVKIPWDKMAGVAEWLFASALLVVISPLVLIGWLAGRKK